MVDSISILYNHRVTLWYNLDKLPDINNWKKIRSILCKIILQIKYDKTHIEKGEELQLMV
jgi:hypothetical protein